MLACELTISTPAHLCDDCLIAVHFWAPTAKWLISIANILDINRPVEKMSASQQSGGYRKIAAPRARVGGSNENGVHPGLEPDSIIGYLSASCPRPRAAVTATGIIWSRYATQITPVNYNLLTVNAVMACTGVYHLARIIKHNMDQPKQ